MNIEIGRKYKIVNSHAGNDGIVVIVTGYAGPAGFEGFHRSAGGHRYFVDRQIKTSRGNTVNHVAEHQLKPVDNAADVISWSEMEGIWQPESLKDAVAS